MRPSICSWLVVQTVLLQRFRALDDKRCGHQLNGVARHLKVPICSRRHTRRKRTLILSVMRGVSPYTHAYNDRLLRHHCGPQTHVLITLSRRGSSISEISCGDVDVRPNCQYPRRAEARARANSLPMSCVGLSAGQRLAQRIPLARFGRAVQLVRYK